MFVEGRTEINNFKLALYLWSRYGHWSFDTVFDLLNHRNALLDQQINYAIGNNTLNVAPLPAPSDSAQILPPCASINPFAIVKPIPSPP